MTLRQPPLPLFDNVPAGKTETSRMAFEWQQLGKREGDVRRVYNAIRDHGGLTCDSAEQLLEMSHQTTSARFNDLKRYGLIRASGRRWPTRTGRMADVYEVTGG